METTTLTHARKSSDKSPNPHGIAAGETVLMDEEFGNPTEVRVDFVAKGGYSAHVTEVESGKGWTVTTSLLTRPE